MANKYHRQNFNKGGGADTGRMGEIKSQVTVAADKIRRLFEKMEPGGRMSEKDKERLLKVIDKKTGKETFRTEKEIMKNLKDFTPAESMLKMAKGGRAALKRGGGKFPDYSGDGKITMRDILMGRGVIPKKNKKKMMAKKFKSPMEKAIKGKKA